MDGSLCNWRAVRLCDSRLSPFDPRTSVCTHQVSSSQHVVEATNAGSFTSPMTMSAVGAFWA